MDFASILLPLELVQLFWFWLVTLGLDFISILLAFICFRIHLNFLPFWVELACMFCLFFCPLADLSNVSVLTL